MTFLVWLLLKNTFVQVAKNARKSPGLGVRKPELRAQTRQFIHLSLNFLICKCVSFSASPRVML